MTDTRNELVGAGVAVTDGDADGARLRQVQAYFSFRDPEGHLHEIAWGQLAISSHLFRPSA